ncbi:MAG TPA: hypothetical protein VEA37_15015, partial [Flavobacterium sp.]|nr:hypothetical protein [Flavobacterium sp.]
NWFAGTVIAHPVRAGIRSNDPQDRLDPIIIMQGLWGFFADSPRHIVWHHIALEARQKREYLEIYHYKSTRCETEGYVSWLLENGLKQSDLLLSLNGLLREWHERRAARAAESEAIFESMREAYVTSSRWCD